MRLCLVIENGKSKGRRVEVPFGGSIIAGRDAEAGLRLPDSMVSRQHFKVSLDVDGCRLEDLGSQNGTYLNDERVTDPTEINVGDMLHVGETTLSLLEMESKGLIGKEIAGHRILDRLGRGGMGTVFRANQLSLSREVAFKVLSAKLIEDETFVDLFFKEARAAGALNHPNIVQVYDVGKDQGLYYFSMEFMPHGSVQDRLNREGKIPWNEATKIVLDAARGLQYAQRKKIVHRDIKPDNLMFGEDGSVKIADLGLAHRADDGEAGSEGILGTPHFIAPEQAQGKAVDVRSDLYSLGASFYRMVAGRNPFHGRQVREIILAQIKEQPTPLAEVDPTIPKEIGAVIARMMEKDPADRFQTPEELIEALERVWSPSGAVGGGAGKKIGIGIAAAAVLGIVGFFALKGGDDKPVNPEPTGPTKVAENGGDPNGTGNPNGTGTTGTGGPDDKSGNQTDPEAEKRNRELAAQVEYQNLQMNRKLAPDERITKLEALAKKHAGTTFGGKAKTEATRLVAERARLKKAEAEKRTAITADWKDVETTVGGLVDESRFAAAHAAIETFLGDHPDAGTFGFADTAKARLTEIEQAARDGWTATTKRVDALAAKDAFADAIAATKAFASRAADTKVELATYGELAKKANTLVAALEKRRAAAETKKYAADRKRLIDAHRTAHAAVGAFDFAGAAAALEKAQKATSTTAYRERYTRPIEMARGAATLRAEFIRRANDRKGLKNRRVPLDVVMVGKDAGTLTKADDEFLHVEVVISGRKNTFKREWSGYDTEKFLELFTDDRWAMKPAEMQAIAFLAASYERFDIAGDFAQQSGNAALIDWVERESKATNLLKVARRARAQEQWPQVRQHTRQLREDYSDTWLFIRNSDGSTPLAKE